MPVLQAITSGMTLGSGSSGGGMNPLDAAMNVVLRVRRPHHHRATRSRRARRACRRVIEYEPVFERVARVAARRALPSRRVPNAQAGIHVLIQARNRNAVGLDAPASLIVTGGMRLAAYDVGTLPKDERRDPRLVARCSYDNIYLSAEQLANAAGRVPTAIRRVVRRLPETCARGWWRSGAGAG